MRIEVRGSTVPISEALETHILRRLDFALRRFANHIDRVVVRLVDLNGPKGGLDKRCRIAATLWSSRPRVIVEATDADAYVAVSQAAARLDERIARVLSKHRESTVPSRADLQRWREQAWSSDEPKESA